MVRSVSCLPFFPQYFDALHNSSDSARRQTPIIMTPNRALGSVASPPLLFLSLRNSIARSFRHLPASTRSPGFKDEDL